MNEQKMGLREMWVGCDEHREYLLEADYHRRVGGWRLGTTRSPNEYERLPERGWRRVIFLWGASTSRFSGPSELRGLRDKPDAKDSGIPMFLTGGSSLGVDLLLFV
jgi:hypothetical protein